MFIERSDFTGIFELPLNDYNSDKLDAIIEDVEEDILRKLLGDHVYLDLVENYETVAEYSEIMEGADYSINDVNYIFEGMKKALKYFIWFEFVRDQSVFTSTQGIMESDVDAGTRTRKGFSLMIKMYNKGVTIYNNAFTFIQDYLITDQESDKYENMNFTGLSKMYWI